MVNFYNRIKKQKSLFVFLVLMAGGLHALAQPLTVNAGADATVCAGSSTTIGGSPTASFGGGTYTYTWSPVTGLSSASAANPDAMPSVTTSYTVSVTDNFSNTATDVVVVTVHALPAATAGADQTICSGTAVAFSTPYVGGANYLWNFGDSQTSVAPNPAHVFTASGTYTTTLMVTASGCTSRDTAVITVNETPAANAGTDESICANTATVFSGPSTTGAAYLWQFGDGNTGTSNTVVYSYTAPGTYTVIFSAAANGCSATDTAIYTVMASPTVSASSTNLLCAGSCNATGNAVSGSAISYNWTPGGANVAAPTNLCAGTYTVTVSDVNGCTASDTTSVFAPPFFNVLASGSLNICQGDSALIYTIVSGATPPYSYLWHNGATTVATTDSASTLPAVSTLYSLTVTDANGCSDSKGVYITVNPGSDIYGHVNTSSGALANGTNTAVLYRYIAMHTSFDTVQTNPVDASGNFHFVAAGHNDYLVEIFADTLVNPTLVPTYYGNQYLWDSATVLNHNCGANDTIAVAMVEVMPPSGPGTISGIITEGDGFSRIPGEPIPGIDVKLGRNPGGQMVASTTTSDPAGTYSFYNIPLNSAGEHYTIYVDIPGLVRDSTRDVTIDATHTDFTNQNYVADSNSVFFVDVTTGITAHTAYASVLEIYPNPSNSNVTVEYSIAEHAAVSLGVYNVLGVKVAELANTEQPAGNYKYIFNAKNDDLRSGIYFITLITDGKANIQRLVITQ